jgi:glyoxylase-like metal-dependent hydrolase (beta-lactamase superfamily II)
MMQSRMLGDIRISRVLEYAGPTHDPAFLFPDLPQAEVDRHAAWLNPTHYIASMNRLIVTIQLWIVHAGNNVIIIDSGVGNHKPRGAARMNMLNTLVMPWLEAAGAGPKDVTHVVHTHLHMDHVGWNTVKVDGKWVPTFPNARYLIPRADFDHFKHECAHGGSPIIDQSFDDSVLPVVDAGLVDFIDDQAEIAGCLGTEPAPGHCPGQLIYHIRSKEQAGIFCGDIMHSPLQIAIPDLNSTYCSDAKLARATRAKLLAHAADSGALLMPSHFGAPHCGYVRRKGSGYVFEGAPW